MPYLSVRGFKLYVEEVGTGPDLLIAHGMFGSVARAATSGVIATEIAARGFHIVHYDWRGHGRSTPTSRRADYHWNAFAEELLGVMDALGLARASVLATSMGAGAALSAALQAPDRFDRLILRAPPAMGPDVRRVRRRLGALRTLHRWLGPTVTTALLGALGQPETAELLRRQQPGMFPAAIDGLLFGPSDLPEARLGQIRCPALILTHPSDAEHPVRSGEVLSRLPHATLRVAPFRDFWRTHPQTLTALVTSFLRGEPIDELPLPANKV